MKTILLLSIMSVSIYVYPMKRDHSEDKQADEDRYGQHSTTPSSDDAKQHVKKRKVDEASHTRREEVQDTITYAKDLVSAEDGCKVKKLLQAGEDITLSLTAEASLIRVAQKGIASEVKLLLDADVDVNTQDADGMTALHWAAMKGYTEIVGMLIDYKADINAQNSKGSTPLMFAIEHGYQEIVFLLIQAHAHINVINKYGYSALSYALVKNSTAKVDIIIKMLIKNGARVDLAKNELDFLDLEEAVYYGLEETVYKLLEERCYDSLGEFDVTIDVNKEIDEERTLLMAAAGGGQLNIVKNLLARGAHVNVRDIEGWSPLTYAVRSKHREVVRELLQAGADVNSTDDAGSNLFMDAAENGDKGIFNELMKAKFGINLENECTYTAFKYLLKNSPYGNFKEITAENYKQQTELILKSLQAKGYALSFFNKGIFFEPLIVLASANGHEEMVNMFIELGANINARDKSGTTLLMWAAINGNFRLVCRLISAGVDKYQLNSLKQSALTLSQQNEKYEVSDFLELPFDKYQSALCYIKNPTDYTDFYIKKHTQEKKHFRSCEESGEQSLIPWHMPHARCLHQTVLIWSILFGHKENVQKLLACDFPLWYLNAQDTSGKTALMYACILGYTDITSSLIQAYKKVVPLERNIGYINVTDKRGNTALTYAVQKGNIALVNELLSLGAQPLAKDLKIAAEKGYKEIVIRLLFKKKGQPALFA